VSLERVFLVAGATGAVGSSIVPLLLAEPDTKVHVLIRASSDDALATRLQALVGYWGDLVDQDRLSDRLVGLRGDVCQPHLGMSERDRQVLASTLTNIIHSAGNVNLNQSLNSARAAALLSIQEVVRFARHCAQLHSAPKVEYLSTVGVAGRRPGLIPEEPLGNGHGYHNTYEQAKAEAETTILREIDAGLQATIHRPSMVVGNSRDGRIIRFQVFYYLAPFLAGCRTKGLLPKFGDVRLDLVPADYVAEAIVASSKRPDSVGKILHLCSGPERAVPLGALGEIVRDFLSGQGERVFAPRYMPRGTLRMLIRIAGSVAAERTRRAFDSLPYFLDYLDEAQLFANERTASFLAADGLQSPRVEEFLPAVLSYWYLHRSAKRVQGNYR
jgi:thioester reductase-like protein